jgi:hypothetical protein
MYSCGPIFMCGNFNGVVMSKVYNQHNNIRSTAPYMVLICHKWCITLHVLDDILTLRTCTV